MNRLALIQIKEHLPESEIVASSELLNSVDIAYKKLFLNYVKLKDTLDKYKKTVNKR